ncbi:CGNR zinc finger domain-containing protein [Micromonospora sp. WMMD961]|uniref:CGNR zinc finger domain-containing protein n=1 Tax=Micromonospora sp. WMMD961 TaxID=3016100 RepID=UPI0024175EFB|nr:CGNR zinc finger domain-containing protein [Micromonospora sp. WMMD961]MDG4780546.1 CGNR zinc finger domain-containing protein [Micromonospora sp. WMMD961]
MTAEDTSGSTRRLGVALAPGGLCVVQDLLNSTGVPVAPTLELLDDETVAQSWLDDSLRTWGEQTGQPPPRISLAREDLAPLRALRDHVRSWLTNDADDQTRHPLVADVSYCNGRLTYAPGGGGAKAVASLVYLEAVLASHTGTLARLKTCMNPDCGAAFYDMSRNSTRVWHDMRTCGNTMNLRASRARRRATPAS